MSKGYLTDEGEPSESNMKDEEILTLSLKKPSYFAVLIDRYQDPFVRKVRRIIGEREEIDDIVQETFVKIYLNASRFKVVEGASFQSWAYKILLNTTFTYYQKLKKEDSAILRVEQKLYESFPDKNIPNVEINDLVARVLSQMPQSLGRALKLHYLLGMPQKEIAVLEGVSVSAIKTRVHRAKKEFKKINSHIDL